MKRSPGDFIEGYKRGSDWMEEENKTIIFFFKNVLRANKYLCTLIPKHKIFSAFTFVAKKKTNNAKVKQFRHLHRLHLQTTVYCVAKSPQNIVKIFVWIEFRDAVIVLNQIYLEVK